tara:strand:+ start:295 stop:1218 length:924 start_codon:yes stop_codon:yes gene_type:complete
MNHNTNTNTITSNDNPIVIKNIEGTEYLNSLDNNSIQLILTDPPYIISKDSGMNKFSKEVTKIEKSNKPFKTEINWNTFKTKHIETLTNNLSQGKISQQKYNKQIARFDNDIFKNNYLKYGNMSGKKFGFKTDYGQWDKDFTIEKLDQFIQLFYKKLQKGGTCIIFFDLWKIETLKNIMEKYKFKQIRFIEWIKTNPVPLNQSVNYLTNCREVAVLGVKGGKPTFHGKYDNAIYKFPIQSGKKRFHPTQKSLALFEALINKHSNEGDIVLDTFLGGGTTALACKNTNRKFKGTEVEKKYYDKILEVL